MNGTPNPDMPEFRYVNLDMDGQWVEATGHRLLDARLVGTLLILAFTFGAVLGVVATILYRTTP